MQRILTARDRATILAFFEKVVKHDPLLSHFPRKVRTVFAERLLDIEIAKADGKEPPAFPPEGYEIELHPSIKQMLYQKAKALLSPSSPQGEPDAKGPETAPDERGGSATL